MINELRKLKNLRENYETLKKEDEKLMLAYTETSEYQSFAENHVNLVATRDEIEKLENTIREMAVELSRETGFEQKKFGLVSVKEFVKVVVNDMETAILWASRNVPNCLALTKDFDKVAKAIPLPFITIEKEYKGAIASNLSELEDENE